jgi:hypothetical protein
MFSFSLSSSSLTVDSFGVSSFGMIFSTLLLFFSVTLMLVPVSTAQLSSVFSFGERSMSLVGFSSLAKIPSNERKKKNPQMAIIRKIFTT